MSLLEEYFADNIISNRSENIWPPYNTDLNPCDYFLWGFLKDKVFSENNSNLTKDIVKEKIKEYCNENVITKVICENVIKNLIFRLKYCIIKNGKHFSNIMKKNRIPLNIVNPNNSL